MTKLTTLQEENNQLKKKLEVAQKWMKKEIAEDLKKFERLKLIILL
ncbi:MAG: hypothetical protein Q9M97_08750 [Candidatus Gracilibacteria bacterium]|nr:hypothetical protein [Candidatus Gracilibacteria bacterium]